ncbi:MAG: MFS transporter [Sphingomonas fennica]
MRPLQVIAVALCVLLNGLDGFDVLSISFALPGIATEWGVDRAVLGVVLSMELIGMAVGSILIGNLADRIGRRPTVLGCLVVMALGMVLASTAASVAQLAAYRLFTGLGIGGMLAAINAVAAENSNAARKNLMVGIMTAGYPIGAVVGGTIATELLKGGDWRVVFHFGAIATALFIPLVWWLMPETIAYLAQRRPANALDRINATLSRIGHATLAGLPDPTDKAGTGSFRALFAPDLIRTTLLLCLAYFTHIVTFYFVLKWSPKIVADMGFAPSAAGGVLVWANVGGTLGAILFSFLTTRFAIRPLLIGAMLASVVMVNLFGRIGADLQALSFAAACVGFCTNAAVVGLYALCAQCFPTAARAGGTGLVIGVGRGGSVLSPILAGVLLNAGAGLPAVATVMAVGSLVGAGTVLALRYRESVA